MSEPRRFSRHRGSAGARPVLLLGLGVFVVNVSVAVSAVSERAEAAVLGRKVTAGPGDPAPGTRRPPGAGTGVPVNGSTYDPKSFSISGSVRDLYPGGTVPLVLTLTNPNTVAIRVSSLTVAVSAAGRACPASALDVSAYVPGSVVVPGNGTATATLQVRMTSDSPDGCRATSFRLTYSGTAVKA